jgi:hypothetical protein
LRKQNRNLANRPCHCQRGKPAGEIAFTGGNFSVNGSFMAEADSQAYKIWGIDGVVYGPVELPVLIGWVQEDRVLADTWVYLTAANEWKKAAQLAELAMFFGGTARDKQPSPGDTSLMNRAPAVKPGALRRIKVFGGLSDKELARFVEYMEVQEVKQFAQIVRQGEPGDAMYFLLQGEVRVRIIIGGKESILAILQGGDFFGEISLFDHGPRSADVIANEDSILLRISAAAFERMVHKAPELAAPFLLAMGKTLTARIRADNKRYRDSVAIARSAA